MKEILSLFQIKQNSLLIKSVEQKYSECKIGCESYPQQIRNLQNCRNLTDFRKLVNHNDYQQPKQDYPYRCEKIFLIIKEDYRPEKVNCKLYAVYG